MDFSEIHYTRSQSIEEAVSSIAKNNNVALKGVIQESGLGSAKSELQGMNMRLKRELDLFANVVHIRVGYLISFRLFGERITSQRGEDV